MVMKNLRKKITVHKGNKFREKLIGMFTRLVHSRTHADFQSHLAEFRLVGGGHVTKFLDDLPVVHWANAYFPACRYGELTSNVAESFNAWILEERCLPIDVMVDQIRIKIMEMLAERLKEAKSWMSCLCPKLEKRLQDMMRVGCNWKVKRSTEILFEVHSTPVCIVDIQLRSCTCREWDIEGFPCWHALVAIQYAKGNVYDFCEKFFKTKTFIDSYANPIFPITIEKENISDIGTITIKPPNMKRPSGRPKRKRGEASVTQHSKIIRCTRCKKVGNHNRRSCKEPI